MLLEVIANKSGVFFPPESTDCRPSTPGSVPVFCAPAGAAPGSLPQTSCVQTCAWPGQLQ